MARKRGNNQGSIYKRPNGTWSVQVTLQGRRLSRTYNTQRECYDWLKKTQGQIDEGMTFASTRISLDEYLSSWLISIQASIKPRTWEHYRQLVNSYIVPSLGHFKVRELRPDQIQDFYNHLQQLGIGIYTIRKVHAVLHSALTRASKLNLIGQNPSRVAIIPQKPAKEMIIFDESQVNIMLVAARESRLEPILHLAVTTGIRQMELLGLKWVDLDWVKHTLKVERQLVRPEEKTPRFTSPKTRAGRRTIQLGSKAIEVLRRRFELQHNERRAAGDRWTENDLIFTNSTGGPLDPTNLRRDFKKLLRETGLPDIRFHDLRHTAASLMLNHEVPLLVVSRMLGHSRPSITLDVYNHLVPGIQAEAAEKMDALIAPIELKDSFRLQHVAADFSFRG